MATSNEAVKKDDAIPDNDYPQKEQQVVNGDKEVPESMETEVPSVSSPVPTDSLSVPPVTSSVSRIISRGGSSFSDPLSLGNVMSFENRLEDFFGDTSNVVSLNEVEAGLSNMETAIQVSPTPILRIHKDHPKSQIIGFTVYQIDVKSAFLYRTIDEEVYVMQFPGFQDPNFLHRVYKLKRLCMDFIKLLELGSTKESFCLYKCMSMILYFAHQIKSYVENLRYTDIRATKTPIDRENPLGKDGIVKDVELHLYRSMIGSLMYLTTSRPYIMFVVCAYARHQVTPKECHLYVVKRIFRYLKGNPKLGLWYPKESPFDLVAYSDSDNGGANQDRKSTTRGCQFLGRRLISWQCKKQTIMATSTTKAEYVAAASGCGQVLWIQNQLLDYGTVKLFASMLVPQGEGLEHPYEPHPTPSTQDESIHHEQITQSPQHAQITSPKPIPQSYEQTISQEPTIPSQSHSIRLHFQQEMSDMGRLSLLTLAKMQVKIWKTLLRPLPYPMKHYQGLLLLVMVRAICNKNFRSRLLRIMRREEKDLLRRMLQTQGVDQREDLLDRDKSTDKESDSTDEMSHVLGSLGAENILANGSLRSVFTTASIPVATASMDISSAVATASGSFPTASIFTTTSVATPTTRVTRSSRGVVIRSSSLISVNIPSISKKDKGKWKMTEPEQTSK
nr:hypothetical protein [Tanacetum cinerariifolium]